MELALNLLWLLAAAGVVVMWSFGRSYEERRTPAEQLRELTALSYLLAALFFAISLSDDLHPTRVLWDDDTKKPHHRLICVNSHSSPQHNGQPQTPSVAASPEPLPFGKLSLAEWIPSTIAHAGHSLSDKSVFGRSPPHSLHS
jgi:hypothetical protein